VPDRVAEEQSVAAQLRAARLRVTEGRLAVFEAADAPGHHDIEAMASAARQQRGDLSTQAVYDALKVPAPTRGEIPCLTT